MTAWACLSIARAQPDLLRTKSETDALPGRLVRAGVHRFFGFQIPINGGVLLLRQRGDLLTGLSERENFLGKICGQCGDLRYV